MQEEKPRRKVRVPLSPDEVYYYKKIKQLKAFKQTEEFKATLFFKTINAVNIVLAGFLSYTILSVLICCQWQTTKVLKAKCSFDFYNQELKMRHISGIEFTTIDGEFIKVTSSNLYKIPLPNDILYVGKDFIFHKTLQVKLSNEAENFWHINTYPILTVSLFALILVFFIYKIDKHLSFNGLLMAFGLFSLASLYFVLI